MSGSISASQIELNQIEKALSSPRTLGRGSRRGEKGEPAHPCSGVLRTAITIDGHRTSAMVDSGASGNFISATFVKIMGFQTRTKKNGYGLTAVDGSDLPQVNQETVPMSVVVQGNREKIVFDIVPMSRHVVILGMPWLRQHNPQVDWKTGRFTFSHGTANHEGPERRQRSPSDELLTIHRNQEETTTGHKDLEQAVQPLPRPEASQSKSADQGNDLEIPEEYTMYAVIFSNEQDERALPEHQWWDHEIKLEPGRVPRHTRIYALSEKEHDALREYIDENIKKGFIRKSQSPISHGILFVPKKNGKLRLCVDFRPLNDMTVKNRYPLPSIKELQDRLGKAKYFTKLDLRGAYNLIRMKEGEEWKTAFNTRFGLFEYTVMPFGLTNAPATC